MDTPENIAEQVKLDLADENAKLVSYTSVKVVRTTGAGGGTTTRESIRMTRQWARITDGLRAHYEDKLRENLYVDNPMADGEIRAGRWRVIRVYSSPLKTDPSQQGVFQTLLYWPAEYGDFGDFCSESTPLNHVDVKIYADSPDLADCAHAFECGHIFQAVNRLDLETGLWHGEMRDDKARRFPSAPGSAVEGWSGSRTEHRKRREARNDTTVPFPTKAALVDALKDGRTIQSDFNINRYALFDWGTVEVFHQMYPPDGEDAAKHIHGSILVRQTTTARVNDTDLPDDDQPEEPGTTTDISFALTADGFFNWTHNLDEAQQFPAKDAPKAEITYGGPLLRVTHREQLNDSSLPNISPGKAGYNTRAQFSINRFGWYDWSTDDEAAHVFPASGPAEITYGGPLLRVTHQEQLNDGALPVIEAADMLPGKNIRAQFSINRFGWYDWSTEREEPQQFPAKDAPKAEITYGGPLLRVTHREQLNDGALPVIEAADMLPGKNIRAQFSINRFGWYDWSTEREEPQPFPTDEPAEVVYGGPLSEITHQERVNDINLPPVAPGEVGHNTRIQFSINRFARYDWSMEDELAKAFPVAGPEEIVYGGPLSSITHQKQVNASSLPQIGVGVTGHNTRAQFNINRFGWYDWSTDDEEAHVFPASGPAEITYGGPLATVKHKKQVNASSLPQIAPGVAGKNTRAQFSINRFGWYDWSTDDEEAHVFPASGPAEITYGGPLSEITHREQVNASSLPQIGVGVTGHNTRAQFNINRFGWYDWSTDDEAAKPASTTWQESSKYEVTVGISFDNHMAMPAHPSATGVGTPIVRVQVGINRFGCLDGTITVTTGVEFSSSSVTLEDSYQQKVTRKWHFNQSSPPSGTTKSLSGGSVKIKTFQPELNRFGLWDYSETETTIHTGAGGVGTYFLYGQPYALRTESATSILYQRYKDKYTHTLRVHETMAAAYDAISGNALSSSVREIAGGVFLSDSVEITPEFISQVALEKGWPLRM